MAQSSVVHGAFLRGAILYLPLVRGADRLGYSISSLLNYHEVF
jgi:hypothetical protein